ncbi:putative S-adenosyl-L-methionine-dependent methyltransferase [Mycobacterium xenopi 3993]|nr:putative S-adenosyl-L-methionine-dependent methyltransferase [Mycobacterium xenopi 3993]
MDQRRRAWSARPPGDLRLPGCAHPLFRRVFPRSGGERHPPGGDLGGRARLASLSPGLAAGTTVYEIDQPKVLEYKSSTLQRHGAVPKANRRAVAVDLREDWPAALIAAGFNPTEPTAWLAEGLLPYLPPDAQDRLFENVTDLSALDSQLAVEAFSLTAPTSERRRAARRARWARVRERLGLDINFETLTYNDSRRADAVRWLTEHGWQVHAVSNADEMARLGRPIPDDLAEETVSSTLLRARRVTAD